MLCLAPAAEVYRNQCGEDLVLLQHVVMFGDEDVTCITLRGALGKPRSDELRERL